MAMKGAYKNTARSEKLVIGSAQFGMRYGIASASGKVRGNEVAAILDLANANGIAAMDTAKTYGNSEEVIGNYLKKRPESSWDIITKISSAEKDIAAQIDDSAEKLTRRPSTLLAHSAKLYLDGWFQKGIADAKDRQIIRKTGVSLYNEDEINRVTRAVPGTDVVQLPMNILDTRLHRRGLLARLRDLGVEIHIRSAFLQGLFYLPDTALQRRFSDAVAPLNKLKSIAAKAGLTLAELSLLWLTSLPEISKVIIGVDSKAQLGAHLETLGKQADSAVFQTALSVRYENENILNPSRWPSIS